MTHLFQKHQESDVAVDGSGEGAIAGDQVEPPRGLAGAWLPVCRVQVHHSTCAVIGHNLPVASATERERERDRKKKQTSLVTYSSIVKYYH